MVRRIGKARFLRRYSFRLVANPLSCYVCDSKEDEHCPETWARKDVLPVECGGPDGVQDARFCIKTIAVFGGLHLLEAHLEMSQFEMISHGRARLTCGSMDSMSLERRVGEGQ